MRTGGGDEDGGGVRTPLLGRSPPGPFDETVRPWARSAQGWPGSPGSSGSVVAAVPAWTGKRRESFETLGEPLWAR